MNRAAEAAQFGLRWQAKRDTALALAVVAKAGAKAPSPLRSAGALPNVFFRFMVPKRSRKRMETMHNPVIQVASLLFRRLPVGARQKAVTPGNWQSDWKPRYNLPSAFPGRERCGWGQPQSDQFS